MWRLPQDVAVKKSFFFSHFGRFCVKIRDMISSAPVGILNLSKKANAIGIEATSEPIYGGYANARGQICLFGESLVYRVNFKHNTVQQRLPLNAGAQARYDATEAGEVFEYCNVKFRRLSNAQIIEICSSGSFRIALRLV
jgi:hypothetical protein